jgi:hypothetical protein
VVRIFPDFGGAYLWDLDGCCISNDNPAFPNDLDERFTAWSDSWEASLDTDMVRSDKARLASEGFDDRGVALATELKRAIGLEPRVIYYCTLRKTIWEVLEDGRIIELPRETDFRQWALDHARKKQLP